MSDRYPYTKKGIFHAFYDNFTDMQAFTQRNWDIISIINIISNKSGYECIYYTVKEAK